MQCMHFLEHLHAQDGTIVNHKWNSNITFQTALGYREHTRCEPDGYILYPKPINNIKGIAYFYNGCAIHVCTTLKNYKIMFS